MPPPTTVQPSRPPATAYQMNQACRLVTRAICPGSIHSEPIAPHLAFSSRVPGATDAEGVGEDGRIFSAMGNAKPRVVDGVPGSAVMGTSGVLDACRSPELHPPDPEHDRMAPGIDVLGAPSPAQSSQAGSAWARERPAHLGPRSSVDVDRGSIRPTPHPATGSDDAVRQPAVARSALHRPTHAVGSPVASAFAFRARSACGHRGGTRHTHAAASVGALR